jgi:hypothetical protein
VLVSCCLARQQLPGQQPVAGSVLDQLRLHFGELVLLRLDGATGETPNLQRGCRKNSC